MEEEEASLLLYEFVEKKEDAANSAGTAMAACQRTCAAQSKNEGGKFH